GHCVPSTLSATLSVCLQKRWGKPWSSVPKTSLWLCGNSSSGAAAQAELLLQCSGDTGAQPSTTVCPLPVGHTSGRHSGRGFAKGAQPLLFLVYL
uniref:Uncharacterized protein n=1 Tax=Cyanoderma ruficeps TaxID=181631 RepID=A0A8C3QRP3_9PASS